MSAEHATEHATEHADEHAGEHAGEHVTDHAGEHANILVNTVVNPMVNPVVNTLAGACQFLVALEAALSAGRFAQHRLYVDRGVLCLDVWMAEWETSVPCRFGDLGDLDADVEGQVLAVLDLVREARAFWPIGLLDPHERRTEFARRLSRAHARAQEQALASPQKDASTSWREGAGA